MANQNEILRLSAEDTYKEEIDALIAADKDPKPAGWQSSWVITI